IALAGVDRGPRRRVDDGVGPRRQHELQHGVAVAHLERRVVGADDLVTAPHAQLHQLAPDLPARAGDEDPHRLFSGRHHHSLARYQSTVSARASSSVRCLRHPSAVIFVMSTEYRRSWPRRSGTYSTISSPAPSSPRSLSTRTRFGVSFPAPML